MLKIKDNIDLKELEKFGYKKYTDKYDKSFYADISKEDYNNYQKLRKNKSYLCPYFTGQVDIFIYSNRIININIYVFSREQCEIDFESKNYNYYIQDLIKAELIEEVEE